MMCVLLMYSTGTLHIIDSNTSSGATSVSNSIILSSRSISNLTSHSIHICSDTVFSEARVMELIDRERDKV